MLCYSNLIHCTSSNSRPIPPLEVCNRVGHTFEQHSLTCLEKGVGLVLMVGRLLGHYGNASINFSKHPHLKLLFHYLNSVRYRPETTHLRSQYLSVVSQARCFFLFGGVARSAEGEKSLVSLGHILLQCGMQ